VSRGPMGCVVFSGAIPDALEQVRGAEVIDEFAARYSRLITLWQRARSSAPHETIHSATETT